MADRFWVGGSGTWNTTSTTNWSTTSGGSSGASVPTSVDSVFFDQLGTYTVTCSGILACLDITVSTGTVSIAGSADFNISGSMFLAVGTTWPASGIVNFTSTTTGRTVTTNGATPGTGNTVNFQGIGGGWTLLSSLSTGTSSSVTVNAGTLNTNGFNVTAFSFSTVGSNSVKVVNLGSSTISAQTPGTSFNFSGTNTTVNAGTSTLNCPGTFTGLASDTGVFHNINFTNSSSNTINSNSRFNNVTVNAALNITGSNTFNNFTLTGPGSVGIVTITLGGTQTINGTLTTSNTAGNRRIFFSTTNYGMPQDLVVNSAPNITDCDFRGIHVYGTAAPISGTRIGNRGECRGITFSAPKTVYWSFALGGLWTDNAWATLIGGAVSTDNFPLPQDTGAIVNTGLNTSAVVATSGSTPYLSSVDMSARTNAMTFNVSGISPTCYGNWTNGSGTTLTTANTITFSGGGVQTITSAGKAFAQPITVDTYGGTVQLADALNIGFNTLTVTNGTFNTAGYAVTARDLVSSDANVKTINFGASTITLAPNISGTILNFATATNLNFNAGTSQLTINTTQTVTFAGGNKTFYNVSFVGTGSPLTTINNANTFNNLTFDAPASAALRPCVFSANQTINGILTVNGGSAVRRIFLQSDTVGTPRTLTVNSISAPDCDFRDITLVGAASGASPTRAGNCGGNSGITFPAPKTVYWNLAGTNSWLATGWAASSGGTPDINQFPLAQDTAVFDNAGAITEIRLQNNVIISGINAANRTTAMALNSFGGNSGIYGSIVLGSGVTVTSTSNPIAFSRNGTHTITSNGVQFGCPIAVSHPLANVQLADALSLDSFATLALNAGTFDAVTYNVTAGAFSGNATLTRLLMGSGTWTLSGTGTVWNLISGGTLIVGTSTILLSDTSSAARTFWGNGYYFNKLTIGGSTGTSTLTINNAVTFGEIDSTKTVPHTVRFTQNVDTTIGKWSIKGTPGNLVTVSSNSSGTAFNLSIAGPATSSIDYLSIRDCNVQATSFGEFYVGANSTNVSNNTRVIFAATPAPRTLYWVGGTGNWSDTNRWSLTSGVAAPVAIPTSLDAVIFNSDSSATAYTATIDAGVTLARCAAFTMAGPATNSITFSGTVPIAFNGNVSFAATGISRTYTGQMNLVGNGNHTFTTNGVTFANGWNIAGIGATWTLGSAFTNNNAGTTCNLTYGTLDTSVNNYNMSFSGFLSSTGSAARSLRLNGSTCSFGTNISGGVTQYNAINLTLIAGTSNIQVQANGTSWGTINGPVAFNNVTFTSTIASFFNINGTNTFNALSFAGRTNSNDIMFLTFNGNQTIGTLTLNPGGGANMRLFLRSDTIGTPRTLAVTTLTAGAADVDFRDIAVTGAAAPLTGTRFGDAKGNSGITFPAAKTVYWNLSAGGGWDQTGWALAAGTGAATAVNNFPLAQDTAVFQGLTGTLTSGATVTIGSSFNIGTIDMSARTTNTITLATGNASPTICGNWINGTGTTITGSGTITFAGRVAQTITSAGKTFPQFFVFNNPGGSVTLQDAFASSASGQFPFLAGTFNAALYNVTLSGAQISSTGDLVRTINFGSGTWTLGQGGSTFNASGTNFTALGTATLSFTAVTGKSFGGGGFNYSGITINQGGSGMLTISGDNTLKTVTSTFSASSAATINLNNNTHTLIEPWQATGQGSRVLTVTGLNNLAPAALIFSGAGPAANVNYLATSHIRVYPVNNSWYAGPYSTNIRSLGWVRTAAVTTTSAVSNFFLLS